MNTFSLQELRDLLSAVMCDTQGTHGDERSERLAKLTDKLLSEISKARKAAA